MIDCRREVRKFIEDTPIINLESFNYSPIGDSMIDTEVVNAAVESYGDSLLRLTLCCRVSSENLVKIADRCPGLVDLRILYYRTGEELSLPAIKAIASLPRLKLLRIGDYYGAVSIAEGALSTFARAYELTHLMRD